MLRSPLIYSSLLADGRFFSLSTMGASNVFFPEVSPQRTVDLLRSSLSQIPQVDEVMGLVSRDVHVPPPYPAAFLQPGWPQVH